VRSNVTAIRLVQQGQWNDRGQYARREAIAVDAAPALILKGAWLCHDRKSLNGSG